LKNKQNWNLALHYFLVSELILQVGKFMLGTPWYKIADA
jgi:hypothetical protein